MATATAPEDDAVLAQKLEQLLANNREPKVSELRTALLAGAARGGASAAEVASFIRTRVSGPSQALMSFCDLRRLYANAQVRAEVRATTREPARKTGGLVAGVGLFAAQDLPAGEMITEWETHGIKSGWNNDAERRVYYDPRVLGQEDVVGDGDDDKTVTETRIAKEGLSLSFGNHTRLYHFPLALTTCPHKLAHFANDAAVCPDPSASDYRREDLIAYKDSASQANAIFDCAFGIRAALVSSKPIAAGEEVLVHWGANHWAELRRMRSTGLRLAAMPEQENEGKQEEEDEAAGQ